MVQEMVQDRADIPCLSLPHYAASSLLESRSAGEAFSLIMAGSRVRVPPLLSLKPITSLWLAPIVSSCGGTRLRYCRTFARVRHWKSTLGDCHLKRRELDGSSVERCSRARHYRRGLRAHVDRVSRSRSAGHAGRRFFTEELCRDREAMDPDTIDTSRWRKALHPERRSLRARYIHTRVRDAGWLHAAAAHQSVH
jgi:hypothetical protein